MPEEGSNKPKLPFRFYSCAGLEKDGKLGTQIMSKLNKGAGLVAGVTLALLALNAQAAQKAAQPAAPAPAAPAAVVAASPNDTARFIAGLPLADSSPLAKWTKDPNWQQHAKFFDDAYKALNDKQLSKIKAWGKQAIKQPQKTLFYMFSGPDYVYAEAFFPQAETYILAGLEPVGKVPEINERTRHGLAPIRASLHNTLNLSYFITSHMSSQLRTGELTGTLPILYLFITRAGKTITDTQLVNLDPSGVIHTTGNPPAGSIQGAKIEFTDGNGSGTKRTLYYFSTDLSEAGAKNSGFLKFCATFGTGDGLVKSASYLLHNAGFATARNFLLENAYNIVQDDTGIPYIYFKQDVWNLHPYGRYVGPIPIFAGHFQQQLNVLFAKAPPIDFGIGYRFRINESNVLVATKKIAPTAAAEPAKPEPAAVALPTPPQAPKDNDPVPANAPAKEENKPAEQKAETTPVQAPPAEAKDGQAETEKEKTAAAEEKKTPESEPEKKAQ